MERNEKTIDRRFPDVKIDDKLNELEQKIDKVLDILAEIDKKVFNN